MRKISQELKTRINNLWRSTKSKCTNPTHTAYKSYGVKGYTICDEWLVFDNFLKWYISNSYKCESGLDLCIIDGKEYCPKQCVLVPRDINRKLPRQGTSTHGWGISVESGQYCVTVKLEGRTKRLGKFKTKAYAETVVKEFIQNQINDLWSKYKGKLPIDKSSKIKQYIFRRVT